MLKNTTVHIEYATKHLPHVTGVAVASPAAGASAHRAVRHANRPATLQHDIVGNDAVCQRLSSSPLSCSSSSSSPAVHPYFILLASSRISATCIALNNTSRPRPANCSLICPSHLPFTRDKTKSRVLTCCSVWKSTMTHYNTSLTIEW